MPPQRPRDPHSLLHVAARNGSVERITVLLARGLDKDIGDSMGYTALILAASFGHAPAVRLLLREGADITIAADTGYTALHASAMGGHLVATKMLIEASISLEAKNIDGLTPLHMTAENGYSAVVKVLVEAGANPECLSPQKETPLFLAVAKGHVAATRELLRAKVNAAYANYSGRVPLDAATQIGCLEMVRDLLELGVDMCGGVSRGVNALVLAAKLQHIEIMAMLRDAGVVDVGRLALVGAAEFGREASVKFLLHEFGQCMDLNSFDSLKQNPPLHHAVAGASSRVARLLIDAGADETLQVPDLTDRSSKSVHVTAGSMVTPLAATLCLIERRRFRGNPATTAHMLQYEGLRRLLVRVDAVRAYSWLWPSVAPCITDTAKGVTDSSSRLSSPISWGTDDKRRMLLAQMFRYSSKP